jgi:CDP-glucose 4,6-dehydratase
MGTVNTLDALRRLKAPCAAVIVTTDKVYARRPRPNVEINALGGTEPYGASKAAVELAVEAWRASFFQVDAVRRGRFPRVAVATARSGNVIGGGDWATDRLVPDIARALGRRKTVVLRNPSAIRPWQHVLDPLAGYLMLAARLRDALTSERATLLQDLSGPFNFGPSLGDHRTVRQVTEEILRHWPGKWSEASTARSAVEVEVLRLHSGKAHKILGWRPKWGFEEAVARTVEWYRMVASNAQAAFVTKKHLADHHG